VPSWGEILAEITASAAAHGGQPDFDGIRRKYLTRLHQLTGRDTIVYSTDWLRGVQPMSSIDLGDMQGMMEVCQGLKSSGLDVILHSPGGSAEATASIVRYLRGKFSDIRVFVPLAAMSAASMWALAGDWVVMGKHSQLGPIDPQLITPQGAAMPARAVIDQFERAKAEVQANPAALGAWAPILQQYGPALLEQCEKAEELARRLVREWLATYMFRGEENAEEKAKETARYFADYETHQSHSLGITRDQARGAGVKVIDLEAVQELQDAVLSVHHATLHTLNGPSVKIIENHQGRAFVLQIQQIVAMQAPGQGQLAMPLPIQLPQQPS